jgi:uncharacterized membrane protein YkvA (DUF1232 family)
LIAPAISRITHLMRERLKRWARELESEGLTLWFCCRHPGMPLLPKLLALLVVGYFLSPIDLIPDFIPVLGYLDELILLPVSIYLILKLVPEPVSNECRAAANVWIAQHKPTPRSITAAAVILLLWMALFWALWNYWGDDAIKSFRSGHALDDAHVAHRGVLAQGLERFGVAGSFVRRDRLRDARELDHHGALLDPHLVGPGGSAAHQEPSARCLDRGPGDLRVRRERVRIADRAVGDNHVGLGHWALLGEMGPHSHTINSAPSCRSSRLGADADVLPAVAPQAQVAWWPWIPR